jgi:ABC-type lipopolysaccharide export system ATPase subunit
VIALCCRNVPSGFGPEAAGDIPMIAFDGLSKQYSEFVAVRGLAFSVQRSEVFGFLGPNGAGKTTTIRMLMGILVPTAGRASIAGLDCQRDRVEVKRCVGYLPDAPIFYDFLRGRDALLADHDGADIRSCRKLDEMVHRISEEDLHALAFHDFRDRRSHFYVDALPSLLTYTTDGFTCRMLPARH